MLKGIIFDASHKLQSYFKDYEDPGRTGLGKGDNIKLIVKRNDLDKAIYVGDTHGDYEATMESGLPFVHAAYGFGQVEEAEYKLQSIRQLPEIAKEILG